MDTGMQDMSPWDVRTMHEATDPRKLARLVKSMSKSGWTGRPVLAMPLADGIQALTGSHRLAAAREAQLDTVPVYVLDTSAHVTGGDGRCVLCEETCAVELLGDMYGDDYDRMGLIMQIGDEDAIRLMDTEIKSRG
jgi:hypothetical protein